MAIRWIFRIPGFCLDKFAAVWDGQVLETGLLEACAVCGAEGYSCDCICGEDCDCEADECIMHDRYFDNDINQHLSNCSIARAAISTREIAIRELKAAGADPWDLENSERVI